MSEKGEVREPQVRFLGPWKRHRLADGHIDRWTRPFAEAFSWEGCWQAEYDACCCSCRFHRADNSHPCTDGGRCISQRGWICEPPEFEGAMFSGWMEHGLCEMWQQRKALGPDAPWPWANSGSCHRRGPALGAAR